MLGLSALLGEHGIPTLTLRSPAPGYVVLEDEHQVAAIPRRDDVSVAPGARGAIRRIRAVTG